MSVLLVSVIRLVTLSTRLVLEPDGDGSELLEGDGMELALSDGMELVLEVEGDGTELDGLEVELVMSEERSGEMGE